MTLYSQTHSFIYSTNHFWGGMLWLFARCWGYKTPLKHGFAFRVFKTPLAGYTHMTVLTKQREAEEEYRRCDEQTVENVSVWMSIKGCIRLRHRAEWDKDGDMCRSGRSTIQKAWCLQRTATTLCNRSTILTVWGRHWYTHLEWGVKCWQKHLGMLLGVLG